EPARRAIATAQRHLAERGLSAEIVEGFFEDVPLTGRFDVILFSYCCYSFIPGSGRRIAALRKAADHLAPSGRIVISYLTERSGPRGAAGRGAVVCAPQRAGGPPRPRHFGHPSGPRRAALPLRPSVHAGGDRR